MLDFWDTIAQNSNMIKRLLKADILKSLESFPAVGLIGPRQSGKTTLAKMISRSCKSKVIYLDLENADDLAKLDNPDFFLSQYEYHLVIIDEAQRKPELFPLLRVLIDRKRKPGRFLILGSASPDIKRQASESLAGRIAYHKLSPFTLKEIGLPETNLNKIWLRGGYPDSFLAKNNSTSVQWREDFIQTHLERDIPGLGIRIPATTLRRFWTMVAHCHSQLWNASRIAESMGIDHKTARRYLDVLQDTFMIRQILPYFANTKKQLIKSPKVYIRDSGILHNLLKIDSFEILQSHPVVGSSWEGFCVEQILTAIPSRWDVSFYRTRSGAEVDIIIQPVQMMQPIAVEIKYSTAPKLTKGFWNAYNDINPQKAFVVYPGKDDYPIAENIWVLPISQVSKIAKRSAIT
jgi:predicted AAA+ superfamily ATPase